MDKVNTLHKLILKVIYLYQYKHLNKGKVRIYQVAPRDGLQNQKVVLNVSQKKKLILSLAQTAIQNIEVGSFVSPKWVPQMANTKQLYQQLPKQEGITYSCLVPNEKGLNDAIQVNVKQVAIFASATQGFSKKNLNCSIQQSFSRFEPVVKKAKQHNIKVRGYVSMVLGCPYDGEVHPKQVKKVVNRLLQMGCYQVSLGDTIGKGTYQSTSNLLNQLQQIDKDRIALHFHDTYGNAIENILLSYERGYRTFDCSVSGIGGCPYSKTPVGNVCTQNVVQVLQKVGVKTGINLQKLVQTGQQICKLLQRQTGYIKL